MSNRLIKHSRKAFLGMCAVAALAGFNACTDSYDLDEKGNSPTWLGSSIYEELQNPDASKGLSGTFTYYLRLIDDLGYKEVMSKTGSKTVFAANDEAFEKFFQSNSWGVKSYDELTTSQKKLLLYASMLDNAILTEMLSNVESNGTTVARGVALKHQTAANAIDSVHHLYNSEIPANNKYWDRFRITGSHSGGIDVVMDNTRPMMVHFTQEQMLNNSITAEDFKILTKRKDASFDGSVYIFDNKIITKDVTCLNGYLNQVDGVIVPPGNLGQLIRSNSDSHWFSRMMDRFCAPYYDATTTLNYNDLMAQNGGASIDSIFQLRYFSDRSQGATALQRDPDGVSLGSDELLAFDPGWNQYYSTFGVSLADMGSIFVPKDEALKQYFADPSYGGYKIMSLYYPGAISPDMPDSKFAEALDSIPSNIIRSFVNNMMNTSFVNTTPSKFGSIMDEASDALGVTTDDIANDANGNKDVRIANNGVAYMLNRVIPPISYNVVSTPALLRKAKDQAVTNWWIQDSKTLSQNFYAYLRASTANYGMFLPDSSAYNAYYIDPVSLRSSATANDHRVVKISYNKNSSDLKFVAYRYNSDGTIDTSSPEELTIGAMKSQIIDIANYCIVSLKQGKKFSDYSNRYFKTKHGGEIRIDGKNVGGYVYSGAQIDGFYEATNNRTKPAYAKAEIKEITNDYKNGCSYVIGGLIQAPLTSVYGCLNKNKDRFSEFLELCEPEDLSNILQVAYSNKTERSNEEKLLTIFTNSLGTNMDCLDKNVNFFNTYNYTVYAPNNEAMQKAYELGLPKWDEVRQLAVNAHSHEDSVKVKGMTEEICNFIRYHFQDYAVYADQEPDFGDAPSANQGYTFQSNAIISNYYQRLYLNGSSNKLTVTDAAGKNITIDADDDSKISNFMARDYVFSKDGGMWSINTSSFAVVHELSEPLCPNINGRYGNWTSAN